MVHWGNKAGTDQGGGGGGGRWGRMEGGREGGRKGGTISRMLKCETQYSGLSDSLTQLLR